jgi:hypothetical protein
MSLSALADDEILRADRRSLNLRPVIDPHLDRVIASFNLGTGDTTRLRAALAPLAAESPIQKNAAVECARRSGEIHSD